MNRRWMAAILLMGLLALMLPETALAEGRKLTVLVYMCASDLESEAGLASDDLQEMLDSGVGMSKDVEILVATGGTREWRRFDISADEVEYYRVDGDRLARLKIVGKRSMGSTATLSNFLKYGIAQAPAERYMLILWDHGGGPVHGICNDENYDGDPLTLEEMRKALAGGLGGRRLDILAFDACLMNSIDTCVYSEEFADYIVASQELVSGSGLNYAAWLKPLVETPDMAAEDVARHMAGSYIDENDLGRRWETATMSVIDAAKVPALEQAAEDFSAALSRKLEEVPGEVARLRGDLMSFGEFADDVATDLVDIGALCGAFGEMLPDESAALMRAAGEAVVYSGATRDLTSQTSGLSFFMPYSTIRDEGWDILKAYDVREGSYAALAVKMALTLTMNGLLPSAPQGDEDREGLEQLWEALFDSHVDSREDEALLSGIWHGMEAIDSLWPGKPAPEVPDIWAGYGGGEAEADVDIWAGFMEYDPAS